MPDRAQAQGQDTLDLGASTLAKLWAGARRTWALYRRSKMGLLGLGIVLGFVIMAVFAPLISPFTPSFRAPSSDIFIADNANLGLNQQLNWQTPLGLTTAGSGSALKRIMVYSPEQGTTLVFDVTQGLSPVTGESGIKVDIIPETKHLLANLSYIEYVKFPTGFAEPGNLDISGAFFFFLQGKVLHQYLYNFVDTTNEWTLPFVPVYHSNLWNGYVAQGTGSGRLALAFANESSVWLLDMRPSVDGDPVIRSWNSTVNFPGAKIISSPIVMDTNQANGSALAVPTDKGLFVYALNVTKSPDAPFPVTKVAIGRLLWSTDYHINVNEVVTPIPTNAAITFPNPTDSVTLFGKTSILLATTDGRIVSYNTFNGTINYVNRVVMPAISSYTITALYPSTTAVAVVGEAGATRGFIASYDPDGGFVRANNSAFSQTEGFINAPPDFLQTTKDWIYSTDRGIIYLAGELMNVFATFSAPSGGSITPVSFMGNIYVADSQTGNYFGTITRENTLYVETLSGVNIAPLPPGKYPSGNRYILGTDYEGHDILSWLIYGTRSELLVGVVAAIFAVVIGTVVGLVAGYYSGLVDDLLMRATDVVLSLPFIVIALLFASVFGPLLVNIIIIIAVLSWAGIARVIRSVTLSLKERSFVDAAIIAGASESRLIFRHIAPNVLPYTFLYMTFTVSGAIITEAILAFLGFGDPSNVTWGMMLQFLQISGHSLDAPWWLLPPGIAITLLSLSFYLIGRAFDEVVNPRLRRR